MSRLPTNAFDHYVALGDGRSYQSVANHFGVTKKAVTNRATSQGWQRRLQEIEQQARERSDERLVETIDAMNRRHLKTMQVVQRKALEALKSYPLASAMEAVRALDVSIKQERLIRGEPSERTATCVESIIEREYQRWMYTDRGHGEEEACDHEEVASDGTHTQLE